METEQRSDAVRTQMSGPSQSPEEFGKKGLPHQFDISKQILIAEISSARKHRSCGMCRLLLVVAFIGG